MPSESNSSPSPNDDLDLATFLSALTGIPVSDVIAAMEDADIMAVTLPPAPTDEGLAPDEPSRFTA